MSQLCFFTATIGMLLFAQPKHANAQNATDVEAIEVCLAEAVMVAEPDHCTGLISDACISTGGATLDCLDREEAVWDTILKKHWPFRCGSCPGGFSMFRLHRAAHVADNPECATDEIAAKRCLMNETARQAQHVFGNAE